jgi:hypothetical protein
MCRNVYVGFGVIDLKQFFTDLDANFPRVHPVFKDLFTV